MLFTVQSAIAQYSGDLMIVIDDPATGIVKNADNSGDITFTVSNSLSSAEKENIRQALEAKDELSNVLITNDVWTLHVESGTPKKIVMTYFMHNGFKYISVAGVQKEILHYLSGN